MLDYPNILRVTDADMDSELCYLIIELGKNAQTLETAFKPKELLSLRES